MHWEPQKRANFISYGNFSNSDQLLLHQAGGVVWLFACHSVSRITHARGSRRQPNMVSMNKGDPLEVISS